MEKTIEALIRLGEGEGRSITNSVPTRQSSLPVNRSLTPAGLSARETARPRPVSRASNNPFDMLDAPLPPQPLSSQSTGTLQNRNPYLSPSQNPFGVPAQQAPGPLDLAFQNMSLAPPSQPLFPNHTGGIAPQQAAPQGMYQAPLTAPLPPPTQNYSLSPFHQAQTYPPLAPLAPQATGYNPFLNQQPQQSQQAPQLQRPLTVNTAGPAGGFGNNPFTRSPTRIQSPTLTQIPEQTQQNFYATTVQQPQAQQFQIQPQMANPFYSQNAVPPQQTQYPPVPQQMGLNPQITGYPQQTLQPQRADKASILALYNYPQLAPQASLQNAQSQPTQNGQVPQLPEAQVPSSMAPGSKNPFVNVRAPSAAAQSGLVDQSIPKAYNASRESVVALGMEWSNGRHSPDAFASLSANTR